MGDKRRDDASRQGAANDNAAVLSFEELALVFGRAVEARSGPDADFASRESAGLALANELCRVDQEAELKRRASGFECDEVMLDGKRYRRLPVGGGQYHGLCGALRVKRHLYREVGVRNGPTIVPLELDAGLMHGATPALTYALTEGYARRPSRLQHEVMCAARREPPSRSTTERICKAIGGAMGGSVARIERLIRTHETVPRGAHGISMGLDRTSVPMQEPAEDPTRRPKRTEPYERTPPAAIDVNYRMAYVGTVSVVNADGRALVSRRYGASADMGPEEILTRMMADVRHLHQQDPSLPIGAVQDGAPEMWNLVRAGLREQAGIDEWFEAIDRHHLLERLADVLRLGGNTQAWRRDKLTEWGAALDQDANAIDVIEAFVRDLRDRAAPELCEKLYEHLTYIENNKDRMRYAALLEAGLPIGSGVTEGACKSLVMTRAKRCGQRWEAEGIDAVLVLRGLLMSDRLEPAFRILRRDYTATVTHAA